MEYLLVSLAVSVDAYLAGFAYCVKRKLTFFQTLYAGSFTFFICVIALVLGDAYLKESVIFEYLGAFLFLFIGFKNYFGSFKEEGLMKTSSAENPTLLGLAVSVDAGVACLAYSVKGMMIFPYAFVMFAGHFLFLLLGSLTAKLLFFVKKVSFLSGVFMIFLGIMKLCVK